MNIKNIIINFYITLVTFPLKLVGFLKFLSLEPEIHLFSLYFFRFTL